MRPPALCLPKDAGAPTTPGPGPTRPRPFFVPRGTPSGPAAQAIVDGFTEAAWRRLVPTQSPRDVQPTLEACLPVGATKHTWTPQDPDRITFVTGAGAVVAVYPNPMDGRTYVMVTALSGRVVAVPVWNLGGSNTACHLQQIIDHEKDAYLRGRLRILAAAYVSPGTRNEAFARRIAIALDEWAKYLPHYYFTGKNGTKPLDAEAAIAMGDVQRVSDHNGVAHEVREDPVTAFDAIYDSPALAQLSTELGYDVRVRITDDFFNSTMDYLTKRVPLAVHVATNLSGSFDETARIATILRRPDLIEWLNTYLARSVQNLVRDGMLLESMAYAQGYLLENRSVAANVRNYFQIWPAIDDPQRAIQTATETYHAAFHRGVAAIDSVRLPDGMMAPFGNTPVRRGDKRAASRSVALPGYGHVALAQGQGAEQVQLNLGFNDNGNHCEQDVLSFTLFGFDKELLSDLRYARMPGRPFTESTVAHNTVTVNRKDQYRSNNQADGNRGHLFTGGNLLMYEPDLGGVSITEVDGARAYTNTVSRYQRLMMLNASDTTRPYVLDLFRVTGGQSHDYLVHGATLFDMTAPPPERTVPAGRSSLPLAFIDKPYPLLEGAEMFVEPPRDQEPWYGAFRDAWSARSNGNWNVTFTATGTSNGARITMLDEGDVDVFVSKSPSPHRETMPAEVPEAFYAYWRPSMMARRRTTTPGAALDSLFVAVIEPLRAAPAITKIERLATMSKKIDHVALKITFSDGREDVVLVNLSNPAVMATAPSPVVTEDGKYVLDGRVGLSSRVGTAERALVVGGSKFERTGKSLAQERAAFTGVISGVHAPADPCVARAFVTDAVLPVGDVLKDRFVNLRFGTYKVIANGANYPLDVREQKGISELYQILRVERVGDKTHIVLTEDPMLIIEGGGAAETTRPGRVYEGATSFEILLSKSE